MWIHRRAVVALGGVYLKNGIALKAPKRFLFERIAKLNGLHLFPPVKAKKSFQTSFSVAHRSHKRKWAMG